MAFTHFKTKGIFIKKEDCGEADQEFTVFTREFGKIKVRARSIRKISSKLRTGADLFYFSEIDFVQGRAYKTLTGALSVEKFSLFRKEPYRLSVAYQVSEAIDKLTGLEERDIALWRLLLATFKRLNCQSLAKENYSLLLSYFLWNLIFILGFSPDLQKCVSCGSRIVLQHRINFSPAEGGLLCEDCFGKLASKERNSIEKTKAGTIKALRIFLGDRKGIVSRLQIDQPLQKELYKLARVYLRVLIEGLRSATVSSS